MPERHLGSSLGRFRIDSFLGTGGFAWVYRGYDPDLDIPVAVKVLKPQLGSTPEFEARFRREATLAARLRHPNIIRILDVGRQDDTVYLVMDWMPSSLTDRLATVNALTEPQLLRLGADVAGALAFAHRKGVIHRDVKVDNILFDEHGSPIVADFGIAEAASGADGARDPELLVGTPQYFAPEQARGLPVDARTDIYALGVTLFRAATGRLPFDGTDWYEVARKHVEQEPPDPRSLNAELSPALEQVILRCMRKDPAERYQTAEELQRELTRLRGETTGEEATLVMTPISNEAIAPRRALRRSLLAAMMVFVALGTAVGLLALTLFPARGIQGRQFVADTTELPELPPLVIEPGDIAAPPEEQPPPPRQLLVISGPEDAELFVNGRTVGHGRWQSGTISAGTYTLAAEVPTISDCPSARETARTTVGLRDTVRVALRPRPCGTLTIDGGPTGAQVELSPVESEGLVRLRIPVTRPEALPVGAYQLRASAPECADYTSQVNISPGVAAYERFRLICR